MRGNLRLARAVLASGALLLVSASARADASVDERRALELFEKSVTAYDERRFGEAVSLLREAHRLKQEPVLLFNLGRAYEGLGNLDAAATAYDEFLALEPNAPDRVALKAHIAALRRDLAERKALEQRRTVPHPKPSIVPWGVAGVGGAGLVAGGVFGLLAGSRHDAAVTEPTYAGAASLQSEATTFATVANVCFVAGGVLVAAGVVWGILDVSSSRKSALSTGVLTF